MYDKKHHTERSDEVAAVIMSRHTDSRDDHYTHGLVRAWRLVTQAQPMSNGIPTPALKAAAIRHHNRTGSNAHEYWD